MSEEEATPVLSICLYIPLFSQRRNIKREWRGRNKWILKLVNNGTLLLQCNQRDGVIQLPPMDTLSTPLADTMVKRMPWQVLKDTISTPIVGNQLPLFNPTDCIIILFVVEIPSSALVEYQMDQAQVLWKSMTSNQINGLLFLQSLPDIALELLHTESSSLQLEDTMVTLWQLWRNTTL